MGRRIWYSMVAEWWSFEMRLPVLERYGVNQMISRKCKKNQLFKIIRS